MNFFLIFVYIILSYIMKYSELIGHCLAIFKGFNPDIYSIDTYSAEYIAQHSKAFSESEAVFVK